MKLRRMTLAVVFLFLSLAMCVLGRPQPRSLTETSSQHSAIESLEVNHAAEKINSSRSAPPLGLQLRLPHLLFSTLNPFTQERRSLKGAGGRAYRGSSSGGGGGVGAAGSTSTTLTIIIIASVATFVILVAAFLLWWSITKKRNPNWRFRDYFKRKKPATEKLMTEAKSGADPDAGQHKVTVDVARLDHSAKSRKQASLHN